MNSASELDGDSNAFGSVYFPTGSMFIFAQSPIDSLNDPSYAHHEARRLGVDDMGGSGKGLLGRGVELIFIADRRGDESEKSWGDGFRKSGEGSGHTGFGGDLR